MVGTGHGGVHGVDAVGKRQERVDRLEHGAGHLDGERTARTADLHDQQHDGEGLADISKRYRKRVDDIGEHEARDPAGKHKLQGVVALDAKEQNIARAHERCLQQGQTAKEQITAQVDLVQAHGDELVDELVVHRDLHHGRQNNRAHPQRQNRIERRHGRAIVADRIDRLAIERNRAGKRRGEALGVAADHRLNHGQVTRHQSTVKLVLKGTDLVRRLAQLIGSLVDEPCSLGETLRERTRGVGQTAHGAIQVTRDTVQGIQNARNGLLELLGLNRERRIVVGLGTRDTRLGIGDSLVDLGTRVVNLRHAVRKGLCGRRQVLRIVAILHGNSAQRRRSGLEAVFELVITHLIGKVAELIGHRIDIVSTRIERRCGFVELRHRKVNMLIRGIECLL